MHNLLSKPINRRGLRLSQVLIHIATLVLLFIVIMHIIPFNSDHVPSLSIPPSLTVLTMLFGRANTLIDTDYVAHNCLLISQSRHKFIIYTDNQTHPFCNVCQCRPFVTGNCTLTCTDHATAGDCQLCHKLAFVHDAVHSFGEYLFIDSDLIIAKPSFLDRLSHRTVAHDFLATYGFLVDSDLPGQGMLNTGLFFIRRLPNVNYSEMVDLLRNLNTNNDQNAISRFVYAHYTNWDTLSRRWNCRMSYLRRTGYPVEHCYTFHGRGNIDALFNQVGAKMLRIP